MSKNIDQNIAKGPTKLDKAKRGRNFAIAIGISSLMTLFFIITLVKFAMA